ncbi:alpha/beta hydrolase [Alphaproteobacteria bacterium]|nr:alpha/beta hydrolase [Alphaproteobacteria bacterium]
MIYIFLLIFLYLFFGLAIYVLQRKILFNKSNAPKNPEEYDLRYVKKIYIKSTQNISLLAWFFEGDKEKPILVYFHGNSFDIGERSYRLKRYNDAGFSTLIVAWRGYSGNDGTPTEKNLYADGDSTIQWILKNTHFKIKDIINYGESLGTGVAVELNLKHNFLCTVLEAPFTSIADVALRRYKIYPTKLLVRDRFDNYEKINQIKSPLLVISGKRDEIVPHKHSVALINKAKEPKKTLFLDEAMHNNLYDFGIEKTVINFSLNLWK